MSEENKQPADVARVSAVSKTIHNKPRLNASPKNKSTVTHIGKNDLFPGNHFIKGKS